MNDHQRNNAYLQAIKRAIQNNEFVLEIGTGSGILSMMAVDAGAEKVISCETSEPIAKAAKEILFNNGFKIIVFNNFRFTPKKNSGSKYPKHENLLCYGKNLSENKKLNKFDLSFLLNAYSDTNDKQNFFNNYFDKLAGTNSLKNQIISGLSEKKIIQSWEKKLDIYKEMRMKYLIY